MKIQPHNALLALSVTTLTVVGPMACAPAPQPGYVPDHIVVAELDAPAVHVDAPTDLWIEMVTEGDFADRCRANFGGELRLDGTHICVVAQ